LSAIIWRKKATGQKWAKKYTVSPPRSLSHYKSFDGTSTNLPITAPKEMEAVEEASEAMMATKNAQEIKELQRQTQEVLSTIKDNEH
jgi:hypothetical protein